MRALFIYVFIFVFFFSHFELVLITVLRLLQCYAYYSKERELLKTGEATLYFSQTILQEQKINTQAAENTARKWLRVRLICF